MAQISNETVNITNTYSNTDISIIRITEDKLVNILTIHVAKMRKSKEWVAALSFSITLFLVLLTSKFEDKWFFTGEQWYVAFTFLFIASVIYLGYTVYNCFKNNVEVQTIVDDIKQTNQH